MALGATRDCILRSVLGQASGMTVVGTVIGASISAAEIRHSRNVAYGVTLQAPASLRQLPWRC
jgi:hypothetical protein